MLTASRIACHVRERRKFRSGDPCEIVRPFFALPICKTSTNLNKVRFFRKVYMIEILQRIVWQSLIHHLDANHLIDVISPLKTARKFHRSPHFLMIFAECNLIYRRSAWADATARAGAWWTMQRFDLDLTWLAEKYAVSHGTTYFLR